MSDAALQPGVLPVGATGRRGVGWAGALSLIATEAALFGYLLFTYYYSVSQNGPSWLPTTDPSFKLAGPNTIVLLLSSVAVWWGERGIRRGARLRAAAGLAIGVVLGAAFAVVQVLEWKSKPYTLGSSGYASLYFTITGFHMAHVLGGLVALSAVLAWTLLGYFDARRHAPYLIGAAYWHFVDAVWLAVFATFYLAPHLW